MKYILLTIACCCALLLSNSGAQETGSDKPAAPRKVLHILTWSDYLDEDLVAEFERELDVEVKFSYFETDEHRDALLAEKGPQGFDLILVDQSTIPFYIKNGWVKALDLEEVPNRAHIDKRFLPSQEEIANCVVPYFWGTMGIVYRSDIVEEPITGWAQLYNGEALMLQEYNEDILYVHPREGSSYWVDHWAVIASAPQRKLADAFLNFINEPERAAANAESLYYATCNKAAETKLPKDFLANPIVYPPADVMARLEPYGILPPRVVKQMHTLYSELIKGP